VDQASADHGNKHAWNEQEKADLVTSPCFNFTTTSTLIQDHRKAAAPQAASNSFNKEVIRGEQSTV
jgi:hypothetical protein